jgi:hypothetical protein
MKFGGTMSYLMLALAFVAGAFCRKFIDLLAERVFKGWGRIKVLGRITLVYHPEDSVYAYYDVENESWLDIPFDVKVTLFNAAQRPRTLYQPRLRMQVMLEVVEGFVSGTRFLTTVGNKPVTLPAESHSEELFRGWASFYADGDSEDILRRDAGLVLGNLYNVTLHLSIAGSKFVLHRTNEVTVESFSYESFRRSQDLNTIDGQESKLVSTEQKLASPSFPDSVKLPHKKVDRNSTE